ARLAVTLPRNTSFAEGACLGIPAVTAHRCLFADGPIAGQTVLVTGGAGAVGHYAVQLAKWAGARVIATVSSAEKAASAAAAGAGGSSARSARASRWSASWRRTRRRRAARSRGTSWWRWGRSK